eukprot:COSAG01_NODE_6798_length_3494_cov_2.059205_2_plen_195_part_00
MWAGTVATTVVGWDIIGPLAAPGWLAAVATHPGQRSSQWHTRSVDQSSMQPLHSAGAGSFRSQIYCTKSACQNFLLLESQSESSRREKALFDLLRRRRASARANISALPRCSAKATVSMNRRLGSGRLHTLCSSLVHRWCSDRMELQQRLTMLKTARRKTDHGSESLVLADHLLRELSRQPVHKHVCDRTRPPV